MIKLGDGSFILGQNGTSPALFLQPLLGKYYHVLATQDHYIYSSVTSVIGIVIRSISYTSTKSWRGYIFTPVCLCVCVCVCVCLSVCVPGFLVNKIPAERMHRFGRGFR